MSRRSFNWTFLMAWTATLCVSVAFWRGLGLGVMALLRLGWFVWR